MNLSRYSITKKLGLLAALCLTLSACQTATKPGPDSAVSQTAKPEYFIYLAGPEVFLPDPIAAGKGKKAKIAELNQQNNWPFTLVGLYPMDNEIEDFKPDFATGIAIYKANITLMQKANFVTANMVRFRGPSMDVGTAFEMGYMLGLDKPVFAYYDAKPFYGADEAPEIYKQRVQKFYPVSKEKPGTDVDGQSIEDFQMSDNLMMIGALQSGAGDIANSFEQVVLQIADHIQQNAKP